MSNKECCANCARAAQHKGNTVCSFDYEPIKLPTVEVCEFFVTPEEFNSWFNENKPEYKATC